MKHFWNTSDHDPSIFSQKAGRENHCSQIVVNYSGTGRDTEEPKGNEEKR
ncbi:MAG: hypothetical protein MRJ65_06605 [Candidatus Brocadiaceae bacterium]|nr:hypothetical protein [Candidatus Brocadiaceae bacterium]